MKVVLALSGGMDSAVLLWQLIREGAEVRTIGINYGQRHAKELYAAARLSKAAGAIEHWTADLSALKPILAGSSQTDPEVAVPEGHYAEESMKLTVVPNRNMILLAIAGAWAVSTKSDAVAYAAHGGDHAIYPDCRPEFATIMGHALQLCDWHPVQLIRPFIEPVALSKADIAKRGAYLGVPFEMTWTCYKGLEVHCGKCGSCCERREAFQLAGVPDPTRYA